MKLALFDPNCYKFTTDVMNHWKTKHEVKETLYYNPELVKWADTVWFETCDNNIHQATQEVINGETAETVDLKNKHVICRAIDIDAWCGLHKQVNWEYVDDVIFIAPHIQRLVEKDIDFKQFGVRVHLIPPGVNTDKFTYRKKTEHNKNIAWVAERWFAKGIDYFLQFGAMLYKVDPEYKIFSVGIWADNAVSGWYREYINYFLQWNTLNVEFIDQVPDMNKFLEDMSYTICFSKKEAFSYAIAEGMAKGLKPIIHNFYGCDAIWPKRFIWNTIDEAIEMILSDDYYPESYRTEIKQYSLEKMLNSFDEIIGG